jgi:hypothetical protein
MQTKTNEPLFPHLTQPSCRQSSDWRITKALNRRIALAARFGYTVRHNLLSNYDGAAVLRKEGRRRPIVIV